MSQYIFFFRLSIVHKNDQNDEKNMLLNCQYSMYPCACDEQELYKKNNNLHGQGMGSAIEEKSYSG